LGVTYSHVSLGGQLSELIALTHQKYGQRAVVLIDEYDKPILDNITRPEAACDARRPENDVDHIPVEALLLAGNFVALKALFYAFYAAISNNGYRKNALANFGGYHASVFHSYFASLGLNIRLEDTTNQGRIDTAVLFEGQVFLFEFKVVELTPEGRALQQIKDKGYADQFRNRGEPIHLIGVELSKVSRNIVGFEVETLPVSPAL
jgi:hypothetical protein